MIEHNFIKEFPREKIFKKEPILNIFEEKNPQDFKDFGQILKNEIHFKDKFQILDQWDDRNLLIFRNNLDLPDDLRIEKTPRIEIYPGTVGALSELVTAEPQRDSEGNLRYLLTSGLAVEVVTGATRYHHDTDLVLFDVESGWWTKYVTDNVTPEKYWAQMKFDPEYLEETAWEAKIQAAGVEKSVLTVHPAIILVQKLSDAWGRPPRLKDIQDVDKLIRYWREVEKGDPSWIVIIDAAIAALPKAEQTRTTERLASALSPKEA